VRRGRLEIAASIDLHGYTQDRAQAALGAFLANQHGAGARVVIVVTGKGRAGETGVLKRRLPAWLDAPGVRPLIAGFAQAHRRHGGAGAFYVFLKRPDTD
jgi:DNA-nicking Smr family endonuclease